MYRLIKVTEEGRDVNMKLIDTNQDLKKAVEKFSIAIAKDSSLFVEQEQIISDFQTDKALLGKWVSEVKQKKNAVERYIMTRNLDVRDLPARLYQ